jgi:hypothetical protein
MLLLRAEITKLTQVTILSVDAPNGTQTAFSSSSSRMCVCVCLSLSFASPVNKRALARVPRGGAGELKRKNKSETSIENDKEGKVYGARERMALGNVKIRKKKGGKKQKIMSSDRNMPETIKSQCNKLSHTSNKLSQQFRLCQNAIKTFICEFNRSSCIDK